MALPSRRFRPPLPPSDVDWKSWLAPGPAPRLGTREKAKIVTLVFPVPTVPAKLGRGLVGFVLSKLQFFADVGIERANECAADGRILRIIIRGFADQVVSGSGKPRIQAPRGQPAIALEFLHELKQTHT